MEEQKLLKRKRKAENENNETLLISACTDLADLYIKEGRHHLAIEEYKIIANIYKSKNKLMEYAQANRGIGEAYLGAQNFEKALEHQKIYLNVANAQENKLEQQRALATIGHIYLTWHLQTQNNPETNLNAAYKYFMKSLMVTEKLTSINKLEKADMLARLFSNLGLVKECLGDHNKAIELLNRSIAICKQNDIYEQLSRGYVSVASLFEKRGEYNNAIRHYNLAIESAKKLKDDVNLVCTALLEKSEALIKLADFHSAKQILLKAYKLKTPNIQDRKIIERSLRIVTAMCYTEDKLVLISDDQKERKRLYETMGDGACELKNYGKALEYYKLMLECAERSGVSGRELASCYYSLAETYKDNNQFTEAVEYFEREYELCSDLQDRLNTLSKIADTKEAAGAPVSEVRTVYERAFDNCRNKRNLKEEKRMVSRCITYLRRNNCHADAFQLTQYLGTMDKTNFEEESSSSDSESEDSETKGNIGDDINLDNITDASDDSDIENKQCPNKDEIVVGRRRSRNFIVKKNAKGESQLHTACINGSMPVVRHLVEQGHPVNVRDNSGWLPLHEACNHGHFEIVKFLLDKGAAINDRGGTHCNGITPLYDAANNGHLRIVELLLSRGASAIAKTDDGDTPLNVLKEWQKNNPLYGDDLSLFYSLVKKMSEAMEKAGQSVKPAISIPLYSQTIDKENVHKNTQREKQLRRFVLDKDEDNNLGEGTSGLIQDSDGTSEYLEVMGTLRNRTNISAATTRRPTPISKRSALVSADDNLDDWLEDDMPSAKAAKKRKTDAVNSLLMPALRIDGVRRDMIEKKSHSSAKKRVSDEFEVPDNFFDNDFDEDDIIIEDTPNPIPQERHTSNENRNPPNTTSGVKRPNQMSLLDAGFSHIRTKTPPLTRKSSESTERNASNTSPFRRTNNFENRTKSRQQKLTNLGHTRSFVEADSTTPVSSQTRSIAVAEPVQSFASALGELMVYVDVKIEGMVFRVPVLLSQVQANTIGWLAAQAANKYARKQCTKPTLELETNSGAILSDDDPLSVLFPLGATQAEPVVGRVVKLNLPPLVERYRDTCSHTDTDIDNSLCKILEEMSVTLNLSNKGFRSKTLVPLCKALNYQTSLLELDLSGNFLDIECITKLCSSLSTFVNLCALNLRCTGLTSGHLVEFVKVLAAASAPVLQKLTSLDLSDNYLCDKSLTHLAQITSHLHLTSLNLSNVGFTENAFKDGNESVTLNLTEIQFLDLSDNQLSSDDIKKIIAWTEARNLTTLNISRNSPNNEGVLADLIDILREEGDHLALKSVNLSRCNINENELYEFLLLNIKKSLLDLNLSYNAKLTGISLRRLLECSSLENINLIGCYNILQYFNDCGECNLLQDSDEAQRKMLKISGDLQNCPEQATALVHMFKSKYCDCYVENTEYFLLLSSKMLDKR